jgi:hypothetical protein
MQSPAICQMYTHRSHATVDCSCTYSTCFPPGGLRLHAHKWGRIPENCLGCHRNQPSLGNLAPVQIWQAPSMRWRCHPSRRQQFCLRPYWMCRKRHLELRLHADRGMWTTQRRRSISPLHGASESPAHSSGCDLVAGRVRSPRAAPQGRAKPRHQPSL